MGGWVVERIVHFASGDILQDSLAHFGFHDGKGHLYAIAHERHFLGLVGSDGRLAWTVAAQPVIAGVPNIAAALDYPMYIDALPDGTLVVSNFGNATLLRIDAGRMSAAPLVDGHDLGMVDMGNCVVDQTGCMWLNEVTGCRVWQLDSSGRVMRVLGDGKPGFQPHPTSFSEVRFNWIYDIRRGPDGRIYVLDSGNYAVRVIAPRERMVLTVAGTGSPGYAGDGGDARAATFGSDPRATFDGPISLSLDGDANVYVGDRFNHVVRMIDARTRAISTIAGKPAADDERRNDASLRDPRSLNLPQISSMDYDDGRLYVPTDLSDGRGDLIVLRKA